MRKYGRCQMLFLSIIFSFVVINPAFSADTAQKPKVTTWKMHCMMASTHYFTRSWRSFSEEVSRRTNGGLVITVYPSSALGFKPPDTLTALRDKIVPIAEISCTFSEGQLPEFAQVSPFYILGTSEHHEKAYNAIRPEYEKMLLDRFGVKILAVCTGTNTELHLQKKINSLDDIKGLKVRTMGPTMARQAKMLGMVPTSISGSEAGVALERGIVDGLYTSIEGLYGAKWYEYVKVINMVHLMSSKFMIGVNNSMFNSLPTDIQKELLSAGAWLEKEEYNRMRDEEYEKARAALKSFGKVEHTPPEEVLSAMKEVGRKIAEETAAQFGDAGKDRLARMLQAVGFK